MLNWAKRVGMLHDVPSIEIPKRANGSKMMKGRPITGEEFERLIAKVPDAVGEPAVDAWRYFLRGLWWSGLRLDEALNLWWDSDNGLSVPDVADSRKTREGKSGSAVADGPGICRNASGDAGGRSHGRRVLFAVHPERHRVKDCHVNWNRGGRESEYRPQIREGEIRIRTRPTPVVRRTLGGPRNAPNPDAVDGHESIEATMQYYVGRNGESAADVLWTAVAKSNTFDNSSRDYASGKSTQLIALY